MPIAEPSSSSGSGPMKRLATNGHAYYSVARQTDAAWHDLLTRVAEEASVAFDFLSYPLPQSLEERWTRADLGCVFIMCGYPISLRQLHVVPIAAPIPLASWAQGRAVYRTDLVVRADSHYQRLSDTFGGRIGWTVRHSHSGYNALRHHLLQYRTPERPTSVAAGAHAAPSTASSRPWHTSVVKAVSPQARRSCRFRGKRQMAAVPH